MGREALEVDEGAFEDYKRVVERGPADVGVVLSEFLFLRSRPRDN